VELAYAQPSSPASRQVTDPQSIVSEQNQNAREVPVEDFFFTRSAWLPSWSPDGKEIVFTYTMTGRRNLWKIPSTGGWPLQLTQSDDRQLNPIWSPDGKWIVYQQDKAGDELWDLYAVPGEGGEVINLTNTPGMREEGPRWSTDGKTIAIMVKPKDSPIYDIAMLDWATKKVHNITNEQEKSYVWSSIGWSQDRKFFFGNRTEISYTEGDIYRIEIATGKLENLTLHKGKILYYATSISPDGSTLLITSTEKGGYQNVALLDVATKKIKPVTDTQWEATSGDFSPNGKSFTYFLNEDGRADAYIVDRVSGRTKKLEMPEGINYFAGYPTAFSPTGDRLIVSHESSTKPPDFWIYKVSSKHCYQLSFSAIASLNNTPLPVSKIAHYKSFDGRMISALMWIPFNLKRDGSNPALVLPHGGPAGQTIDEWNTRIAAFVSRGYICIAPNVRGSTGFGTEFQNANYQDLGGGDLQDEVYAANFLKSTGYTDSLKIGITGGSYGGFMTLMAVAKTPDVWAAGVELYGIINWLTMAKHSDPILNEYVKTILGDPQKDSLVYKSCSPLKYIHQVKCPVLVLQGDNDVRVPKEEAQQVVDILKNDGKVVDVHYYANEGHGFSKRENQIDAIKRTLDWFDRYLKNRK
jgi:dipeptidyl aminopeptidase/acylaminoacyl peptidase